MCENPSTSMRPISGIRITAPVAHIGVASQGNSHDTLAPR